MTPLRIAVVLAAALLLSAGLAAVMVLPGPDRRGAGSDPAALPDLGQTPAWTLTDSNGDAFSSDDLRGSPYVIDFIFTRCKLACPMMTLHMKDVQDRLAQRGALGGVKLVSVSVDPEHDRPDVLAAFKQRYDAHREHWKFLTGESKDAVWSLVENGYLLPLDDTPENELMPIQHSTSFLLVDADGVIRGRYDSDDQAARERLTADAARLAQPMP